MKFLRLMFFISAIFCSYHGISAALRPQVPQQLSDHDVREALQKYQRNVAHEIWRSEKLDQTTVNRVIEDEKKRFKADIYVAHLPKELVPSLKKLVNAFRALPTAEQTICFLANKVLDRENKKSKESLECPACRIPLNTSKRGVGYPPENVPLKLVVFDCGHSICDVCFEQLLSIKLCPICKTELKKAFDFQVEADAELFQTLSESEERKMIKIFQEKEKKIEQVQTKPIGNRWACPACTLSNPPENVVCAVCRGSWACPSCTFINLIRSNFCDACGVRRP